MTRASRSNKKQPAFDPSELTDLIFSPAVGTGVGSHLVGAENNFPALNDSNGRNLPAELAHLTTVGISLTRDLSPTTANLSTVAHLKLPTVDKLDMSTIDMHSGIPELTTEREKDSVPVAAGNLLARDMSPTAANVSTVAPLNPSTIDKEGMSTMDMKTRISELKPESAKTYAPVQPYLATVDDTALTTMGAPLASTVDMSAKLPLEPRSVPNCQMEAATLALPVVHESKFVEQRRFLGREEADDYQNEINSSIQGSEQYHQVPARPLVLWITENGDLIPDARVKRIRLAQDVINSAEEAVYDTLWNSKSARSDEPDSSKVVQAGYDYLVKRTRLSKRTIQRIVEKLIDKDFISIERPADIYQRTSTVYRVFNYKTVLERHSLKNRSHVAKLGPGFSYVRPFYDPRTSTHTSESARLSTVVATGPTTVDRRRLSPVDRGTTDTVEEKDLSTMAKATTTYIDSNALDQKTSSSILYEALSHYGPIDDDIIERLIRSCRQQTADCSEEEIAHFVRQKGALVRIRDSRIYSPIGFLLTAVPKCLSGEAFRLYREEQQRIRTAENASELRRQAELDVWRREQELRLLDPEVPEDDKQFIRECLGII